VGVQREWILLAPGSRISTTATHLLRAVAVDGQKPSEGAQQNLRISALAVDL